VNKTHFEPRWSVSPGNVYVRWDADRDRLVITCTPGQMRVYGAVMQAREEADSWELQ
jgi:hypothetical protein